MSQDIVVDALPYFDSGYEEQGVRNTSLAMVEEECRRYRPTKNYLEHLPPINTTTFETELMRTEFERIQNRMPMEPLSMKRYELPPPPPSKISELSAWQDSVENSMAQLEHQAVRAMNLELMLEFGCETWKVYLDTISSMLSRAQTQLEKIKQEIVDINWQRKDIQSAAGVNLRALETQWVMLVSKNYEIEQVSSWLKSRFLLLFLCVPFVCRMRNSSKQFANRYKCLQVCAKLEEEIANIKRQLSNETKTEAENDIRNGNHIQNDNEAETTTNDEPNDDDEQPPQPDDNEPMHTNDDENNESAQEHTDSTTMDETDQ